jgi:probable phosphoglycerate mutase
MTVHRLLLARHGQTSYNTARRFTGWADPPLTPRGRAESRALGRRLSRLPIDFVYCSDLERARQTAELALAGRPGLMPTPVAALRESCFGAWEGLTFEEASGRYPDAAAALLTRSIDFCAPGGETIPQVRDRIRELLTVLHERHNESTVLLVASGGPLQILLADLFSMPVEAHWRLRVSNCALSIVDFSGNEPFLTLCNDRSHLERFNRAIPRVSSTSRSPKKPST